MEIGESNLQDILSSIKKVIAEDSQIPRRDKSAPAKSPRNNRPSLNRDYGTKDDILELTNKISANNIPASKFAASNFPASNFPASNFPASNFPASNFPASNFPDSQNGRHHDDGDDMENNRKPLISEDRQKSMRESLAALAALSEPGRAPQIVRSGETSLESMVQELLRPMLAEWLEENLPAIVEAMVAEEIANITGINK